MEIFKTRRQVKDLMEKMDEVRATTRELGRIIGGSLWPKSNPWGPVVRVDIIRSIDELRKEIKANSEKIGMLLDYLGLEIKQESERIAKKEEKSE